MRKGDPLLNVADEADLREALLASDAIFVPDTKASTAGIHVAKVLARIGALLRDVTFPSPNAAVRDAVALCGVEAAVAHEATYPLRCVAGPKPVPANPKHESIRPAT